jgi:histidine triad (HIT) family protein
MKECIFCKIAAGQIDIFKVFENDTIIAFFDYSPINAYHTLVIPKKHFQNIFDIDEADLIEVTKAIKNISILYKEKLDINNVQIMNNSGHDAQQEVMHVHFHIIPRYDGDGQDIIRNPKIDIRQDFGDLLKKIQ